jgi:hypothetical protein
MTLPEEIARAEAAYYQQLAEADLTAAEFDAFLSHLPPKAQLAVAARGVEAAVSALRAGAARPAAGRVPAGGAFARRLCLLAR